MHTCIHTYMFVVVNFDVLTQASNFQIEMRQVVFLCWMQDSTLGNLRHQFTIRLNAHSQTDWAIEDQAKNLNSTARPYDERAFSPLGSIVTHCIHHINSIYFLSRVHRCIGPWNIDGTAATLCFHMTLWHGKCQTKRWNLVLLEQHDNILVMDIFIWLRLRKEHKFGMFKLPFHIVLLHTM